MPRRKSARRSSGRPAPRPAPVHSPAPVRPAPRPAPVHSPAPVRNPPQPASHAPPPAPVESGGFAKGMAFGAGYAVANRLMGPPTIQHKTVVIESAAAAPAPTMHSIGGADACNSHSKAFQDCLNSSGSDSSKCQFYIDVLNECRRNSGSMPSA